MVFYKEINKKNLRSSFYGEENILISEPTNVFDDNAILTDRNFENANSEFNFNDIIPPQIKQRSTPEPAPMHAPSAIQRSIQPIFNQTLVSSGIGNNVDSLIAQASQVPFLYHNQQLWFLLF